MLNIMDISVIIPVYNSRDTIVECLDSVVGECSSVIPEWEIIVVDDGSTDDSAEIVSTYIASSPHGCRIRLVRQPNGGVSNARNAGLRAAQGALIAFNDSDDKWPLGKVAFQTRYFSDHPEIDLTGGIKGEDTSYGLSVIKLGHDTPIDIKAQVMKNYFSTSTVMFRACLLKKTGLFDESMRYAEDFDLFNRMVINGKCAFIKRCLAVQTSDKRQWGDSGLSGNLVAMERGELRAIANVRRGGFISRPRLMLAYGYSIAKFIRRWIISNVSKTTSRAGK